MVIQESAEMYLETIISLQNKKGNVRAIDISREMGFSRPTVSIAVHKLEENGALFQVWLEDEESLQVKINVMKEYGIGGVAAWKLGYESGHPEVWTVISDFVNG